MQTKIFGLRSRLGLLHAPLGYSDRNIGVEDAPLAIATNRIDYVFPLPESISSEQYLGVVAAELQNAANLIYQRDSQADEATVSIALGGDHSVALAHVSAMLKLHNPSETLFLQIDSHADLHQPETSPSGNFHGMWLRPIVSKFSNYEIDSLVPSKLPTQNLIMIGNLDIEQAEKDFLEQQQILRFDHNFANKQLSTLLMSIDSAMQAKSHIHVSLDIDSIEKEFAPGTGMPCELGLAAETVGEILAHVSKYASRSLDLVEVNPRKDEQEKTVRLARKLLKMFARQEQAEFI